MVEAESGFKYQYEAPKQPGDRPEFGRFSERSPFQILEDPFKKDLRISELISQARNLPSVTVVIPNLVLEKKPEVPKQRHFTLWDLLLLIIDIIIETAKALLSGQTSKKD